MNKKPLLIGALTLTMVGGGVAFQATQFQPDNASAASDQQVQADKGDGDGEVADDQEKSDGDGEMSDAKEQALLKKQTDVSQAEAKQAALNKVSGKAGEIELENENGTAVYNVAIDSGKATKEVKIDASSGKVLKVENDSDKNESEKGDKEEGEDGGSSDSEEGE